MQPRTLLGRAGTGEGMVYHGNQPAGVCADFVGGFAKGFTTVFANEFRAAVSLPGLALLVIALEQGLAPFLEPPVQFELRHHQLAEGAQGFSLVRRELARDAIDHTQRAESVLVRRDQRGAGVKTNGFASTRRDYVHLNS